MGAKTLAVKLFGSCMGFLQFFRITNNPVNQNKSPRRNKNEDSFFFSADSGNLSKRKSPIKPGWSGERESMERKRFGKKR